MLLSESTKLEFTIKILIISTIKSGARCVCMQHVRAHNNFLLYAFYNRCCNYVTGIAHDKSPCQYIFLVQHRGPELLRTP